MRIIQATLEHLDLLTPLFVKYREFYGSLCEDLDTLAEALQELERDIERSRAQLDQTIDRLQDKMTVSGVVIDTSGSLEVESWRALADVAMPGAMMPLAVREHRRLLVEEWLTHDVLRHQAVVAVLLRMRAHRRRNLAALGGVPEPVGDRPQPAGQVADQPAVRNVGVRPRGRLDLGPVGERFVEARVLLHPHAHGGGEDLRIDQISRAAAASTTDAPRDADVSVAADAGEQHRARLVGVDRAVLAQASIAESLPAVACPVLPLGVPEDELAGPGADANPDAAALGIGSLRTGS